MQFFTLAATALLASTGLAASTSERTVVDSRTVSVLVQFQGAAGVAQNQYVPADGTTHNVWATFSASHIAILDPAPASVNCVAYGVDASVTEIYGAETVDVGPPQVQNLISCSLGPR